MVFLIKWPLFLSPSENRVGPDAPRLSGAPAIKTVQIREEMGQ